jgi:hypothetical protein
VYKGQGRIRRKLVTFDYKGFLVQAPQLQGTIPGTSLFQRFPTFFQAGVVSQSLAKPWTLKKLVITLIVERVQPRTSKGITDLLLLIFVPLLRGL